MSPPRQVPPWVRRLASVAIDTAWTGVCRLGAIGPDDRRGRRFGAFGEGSIIAFPPGAIYNERWIRIGSRTMIGPHVSLTAGMAPGQEMVSDPVVRIGDRTLIGQGSYIVGHFCIEIGDDIQTGPYVYITDQNHTYTDPDVPIGRQWPTEQSVSIGSGSWLGTGVIVLPGAHIGRNVAVGAGSVVVGRLPDHCVAVGVPARVVKRYRAGEGWVATGSPDGGRPGATHGPGGSEDAGDGAGGHDTVHSRHTAATRPTTDSRPSTDSRHTAATRPRGAGRVRAPRPEGPTDDSAD